MWKHHKFRFVQIRWILTLDPQLLSLDKGVSLATLQNAYQLFLQLLKWIFEYKLAQTLTQLSCPTESNQSYATGGSLRRAS